MARRARQEAARTTGPATTTAASSCTTCARRSSAGRTGYGQSAWLRQLHAGRRPRPRRTRRCAPSRGSTASRFPSLSRLALRWLRGRDAYVPRTDAGTSSGRQCLGVHSAPRSPAAHGLQEMSLLPQRPACSRVRPRHVQRHRQLGACADSVRVAGARRRCAPGQSRPVDVQLGRDSAGRRPGLRGRNGRPRRTAGHLREQLLRTRAPFSTARDDEADLGPSASRPRAVATPSADMAAVTAATRPTGSCTPTSARRPASTCGVRLPRGQAHAPEHQRSRISLSGDDATELAGYFEQALPTAAPVPCRSSSSVGRHVRHADRPVRHPDWYGSTCRLAECSGLLAVRRRRGGTSASD